MKNLSKQIDILVRTAAPELLELHGVGTEIAGRQRALGKLTRSSLSPTTQLLTRPEQAENGMTYALFDAPPPPRSAQATDASQVATDVQSPLA